MLYVQSLREQCGPRLRRMSSGDGGIPLVAFQTSNVWANVVTALVLLLSPAGGLRRGDPGETESPADDQLSDEAELVYDLGGVYCGVYEPCSHGESVGSFVSLVNSTGITPLFHSMPCRLRLLGISSKVNLDLYSVSSRTRLYRFPYVGAHLRYLVLSQTPSYTARPRIRLVYKAMCLFTPQLWLGTHFAYPRRDGSG